MAPQPGLEVLGVIRSAAPTRTARCGCADRPPRAYYAAYFERYKVRVPGSASVTPLLPTPMSLHTTLLRLLVPLSLALAVVAGAVAFGVDGLVLGTVDSDAELLVVRGAALLLAAFWGCAAGAVYGYLKKNKAVNDLESGVPLEEKAVLPIVTPATNAPYIPPVQPIVPAPFPTITPTSTTAASTAPRCSPSPASSPTTWRTATAGRSTPPRRPPATATSASTAPRSSPMPSTCEGTCRASTPGATSSASRPSWRSARVSTVRAASPTGPRCGPTSRTPTGAGRTRSPPS
ncbi:hypothetical protein MIND_00655100 [Mycena indigotica]|uniref:Uncharacterized protein n=1 Tax=Mycena indigotica TaxID=2126181 RepID=A0A8H6STS6_9AGAR|nr:uncharacterized protein MIND_00655100 [Mycena indigotica]KAF7304227.1 hypothetical protein MIND_00655100 [Mycena indigotica]